MKNGTATTRRRSDNTPVRANDSAEHSAAQREATDLGSVARTQGVAAQHISAIPAEVAENVGSSMTRRTQRAVRVVATQLTMVRGGVR